MEKQINYYSFKSFDEIYKWFDANHKTQTEMFCEVKRGDPYKAKGVLSYYDAVNAALCFGWIDSTLRNIDGVLVQRFSPRKKNSHWTELNIQRCRDLYNKGLMKESGLNACPIKFTNNMIAICGLNCEKCEAYLATINNDDNLRKVVAEKWSKLNGVEIKPSDINCEGCRTSGVKTPFCATLCPIRQCAIRNSMNTCGSCKQLDKCQTIKMIISTNKEAKDNLKKLK